LNSLRRIRLVLPTLDFRRESALAENLVNELGIQPSRIEALMKNLSGGNMQKVGLAKWLCRNPDTLILVNPTAGIDTKAKMEIYQLLLKMRAEGKSVILLSEDAQEIRRMSDRVVRMEQGRVNQILEPG
jgi:ABC-type sugar transport system ATPase subunit